ncbi:MAG: allose kinase [Lachnospiraceae bacterium]
MKYIIGMDIGGTNLRIGLVDKNGILIHFEKTSSSYLKKKEAPKLLSREIIKYIKKNNISGQVAAVAVGVPSMVSKDKNFVFSSPYLKGLEQVYLGDVLTNILGIPAFVDRDVNYLLMNDIKKYNLDPEKKNTVLSFYMGTGIGNAMYINGHMYAGKNGCAGELGHIPLYGVEEECACGTRGCMETKCSGKQLQHMKDEYWLDTDISDVFTVHGGDPLIHGFIDTMAIAISTEVTLLDPDYIVIAGGVFRMKDFPQEQLIERIRLKVRHPYPSENMEFVFPEQEQADGVIGGAWTAMEMIGMVRQPI